MTWLTIAPDLRLPVDAVTQKLAFLGRTGSGKTYGASKLAELMLGAGAQIVALDPVGVWYGLRLAGNGTEPSDLELPVFGGLHGDIPIEPTSGALLADLVVDRGISAILDVSQLESDRDKARFAADFANRFFFRKKAAPSAVHLFIEECQEFVPQNPAKGEEQMLHHFHRLIKLGRNFGIGVSLISQRPQEVNKKALNQTELMLAFQMTGPQERKAISSWVSEKGADEDVADILPKLQVGEAHVWSPQWLQISRTVKIAAKRTFNASSTPTVGGKAVEARPLGAIDLEKLQKAMASTIEKSAASDPERLKKKIAERDSRIRQLEKGAGVKTVEKLVVDQAAIDRAVNTAIARHRKELRQSLDRIQRLVTPLFTLPDAIGELARIVGNGTAPAPLPMERQAMKRVLEAKRTERPTRVPAHRIGAGLFEPDVELGGFSITRSKQRILDAVAALERLGISPARRVNVAFFAGYTENGHFNNMVGELRTNGLLDYPSGNMMQLTDAGGAIANADANAIQSLDDLHNTWLNKLSASEGKLLRVLLDRYPTAISRAELSAEAGYTENGHFNNMVGHLRTLGAADYPSGGQVVATGVFFPEGLS